MEVLYRVKSATGYFLQDPIFSRAISRLLYTKKPVQSECCNSSQSDGVPPTKPTTFDLDNLPPEVKGRILEYLPYEQIQQLPSLSKSWKALIKSDEFFRSLSLKEKLSLTACYFFIEDGALNCAGFDRKWPAPRNSSQRNNSNSSARHGKWRRLPPLTFLPPDCHPDTDLFKQFLVCANSGLMCMNFSKSPHRERLIVFNPLSRDWRELPPLLHRRNPVLMHMLTDPTSNSYQILVAGSAAADDETLSIITELYDSKTAQWERVGDLPGPAFALNEYQSGVHHDGNILCIGFVQIDEQIAKGILHYNVGTRRWSSNRTDRPLPSSPILQLVENNGEVFLFSERESRCGTEHWVDRVEWTENHGCKLVNVIKKRNIGGRSLEVYPEFALVPYSDKELCLYNTVEHSGEVYDVQDQGECESLQRLPEKGFRGELGFFSLNPISFAIEPGLSSKV